MPDGATNEATYRHLKNDYHQNLRHYRGCFAKGEEPEEQEIAVEAIAEYVSQRRDPQDHNNLVSFKHLAVREVKFSRPFANPDVGKIALVDIPGLGDSKLGDEEIMMETLGKEVDVVIFVTRPDPQRYQWFKADNDLYDKAAAYLNNFQGRVFMAINHSQRTQNLKACQTLKDTIQMRVVGTEIVDCSSREDANGLFDSVLNHLTNHILEIDEEYADQCQQRLFDLRKDIDQVVQNAKRVFGGMEGNLSGVIDDQYDDLFGTDQDGWWRDMKIAFQELRFEFARKSQLPSPVLQASVEKVCKSCKEDAGILSSDNPEAEIREQVKASNPMKAYADYRDQLRTLLSDHFNHLDEGLKNTTDYLKKEVANILIRTGRLNSLVPASESAEFLRSIKELLEREHPDLKRLHQSLSIVDGFELSYSGLIEPQIYQHLVDLSNIQLESEADKDVTLKVGQHTTADLILTALQVDYDRTVARIKARLEELLYQPATAAYARAEKFIDSAIYHKEAQKDWKKFLRRVRSKIWEEEIGKLEQEQQRQQDWMEIVSRLEKANSIETIRFLSQSRNSN
jgi:hypothetical protein